MGYNWFERNNEHAVRIVPLLSAVGRIANNTFVNHSRYVLLLDNGDDLLDERYYQSAPVRYEVKRPVCLRIPFVLFTALQSVPHARSGSSKMAAQTYY